MRLSRRRGRKQQKTTVNRRGKQSYCIFQGAGNDEQILKRQRAPQAFPTSLTAVGSTLWTAALITGLQSAVCNLLSQSTEAHRQVTFLVLIESWYLSFYLYIISFMIVIVSFLNKSITHPLSCTHTGDSLALLPPSSPDRFSSVRIRMVIFASPLAVVTISFSGNPFHRYKITHHCWSCSNEAHLDYLPSFFKIGLQLTLTLFNLIQYHFYWNTLAFLFIALSLFIFFKHDNSPQVLILTLTLNDFWALSGNNWFLILYLSFKVSHV